jgi:hypothetical protein
MPGLNFNDASVEAVRNTHVMQMKKNLPDVRWAVDPFLTLSAVIASVSAEAPTKTWKYRT